MQIQKALEQAIPQFKQSDSARLDAEVLLAFILEKPREFLLTWPESELTESEYLAYQQLVERRARGEPIAYLTGKKAFWDFELSIDSNVLIPRPETELLVELCLDLLPSDKSLLADLGTGSGAIALALAKQRSEWQILACDNSELALEMAQENANNLKLRNVSFYQGSWCEAFTESGLDAIISNPPYIDARDIHLQQDDLRFEPLQALVSADNGLADIKLIANQSRNKLKVGGLLLLEHGYQQAEAVREVLKEFSYDQIASYKDIAGHERVTLAVR